MAESMPLLSGNATSNDQVLLIGRFLNQLKIMVLRLAATITALDTHTVMLREAKLADNKLEWAAAKTAYQATLQMLTQQQKLLAGLIPKGALTEIMAWLGQLQGATEVLRQYEEVLYQQQHRVRVHIAVHGAPDEEMMAELTEGERAFSEAVSITVGLIHDVVDNFADKVDVGEAELTWEV